jgi:protein MpaA
MGWWSNDRCFTAPTGSFGRNRSETVISRPKEHPRRAGVIAVALLVLVPSALHPPAAASARKRVVFGHSTKDRRLRAVRLGDGSAAHTVLVVGCIHGNECAGKAVIRALKRMNVPTGLKVWTVKDLNPDGSRAGTRQNGRGVDLNRNFGRKWKKIGEPWDTYHSGKKPFSEPETRAARRFILRRRPDVTIWYHQHMALVARSNRREVQARYAKLVGLPLVRLEPLPGTATRWQNHRLKGSTAFVVELRAGPLRRKAAKRHARAVIKVGRM